MKLDPRTTNTNDVIARAKARARSALQKGESNKHLTALEKGFYKSLQRADVSAA